MKRNFGILLNLFAFLILVTTSSYAAKISQEEFNRLQLTEKLLKSQIGEMESEFAASPSLAKYRVEYLATVATKNPVPVSDSVMAKTLASAKFVFLGDEHTTAESQKNTVSVLALMLKSKKQVTLVIEWIDESFQNDINIFLNGKLPLQDLKKKISFDKNWGFSWANYSKILLAAKKLKVPVLLVEKLKNKHSLSERDTFIASSIAKNYSQNKGMRYLVVYGEYHLLGPNHLTEKCSKSGITPQTILVGDAADVYWKLLGKAKDPDKVGFARLKSNVFYIRNGTPLERSYSYRSYLMKILGWKNDDFGDSISASDIKPKSSVSTADFESLHNSSR